jgi:anti-anti-sigma factor
MSLIRGGASEGTQRPMAGWIESDPMFADKQLVIRHTIPRNGLSFSGVIDMFNSDDVAKALLKQLQGGDGDLHLDLSQVEFCDVSGIRALVSTAESAGGRRVLVLHGLPPLLQKVMRLVGWEDMPNLEICGCTENHR